MTILFLLLSIISSPTENDLSKTLFLIKYSQEYALYKNDINFNEKELKTIISKDIEKRLKLYQEAQKKVSFNKNKYFKKILNLKQQYNTDDLGDIAVRVKIPKDLILKDLKIDTYIEDFLSLVLFKNLVVSNEEIKSYYFSHLDDFTIKKEIKLYHIFSSSQPKIIEAQKKLDSKKNNFETIAKIYSEAPEANKNGYIGWVSKKDMPSYFSPAFKIKKGKFSKVIQSGIGYHIFYVKDIKSNHYISINNVEKKIKNILLSKKQEDKLSVFLKKENN